jgi:hypothetical protein
LIIDEIFARIIGLRVVLTSLSGKATYQDLWEMASTFACEEGGHNGINHARRNKNGVFG